MRIRTALLIAGAGYAGYQLALRPWWDRWGAEPIEAGAPLPGDDLVLAPDHVETRGIDIAAPPEAVWPWLVQMGYGRGGWYSYDRIDMEGGSATEIRPELQGLAIGDIVPTHPGGGLVVREIEQDRALVLYVDDELLEAQAKAAQASATAAEPAGLRASGAFMSTATGSRFVASWAFVLSPRPGGSRLVERFRIGMPEGGASSRVVGPAMGFGTFLMMRKQLLGIRDRVESRVPLAGAHEPKSAATTEPKAMQGPAPEREPAPEQEPEPPLVASPA